MSEVDRVLREFTTWLEWSGSPFVEGPEVLRGLAATAVAALTAAREWGPGDTVPDVVDVLLGSGMSWVRGVLPTGKPGWVCYATEEELLNLVGPVCEVRGTSSGEGWHQDVGGEEDRTWPVMEELPQGELCGARNLKYDWVCDRPAGHSMGPGPLGCHQDIARSRWWSEEASEPPADAAVEPHCNHDSAAQQPTVVHRCECGTYLDNGAGLIPAEAVDSLERMYRVVLRDVAGLLRMTQGTLGSVAEAYRSRVGWNADLCRRVERTAGQCEHGITTLGQLAREPDTEGAQS